MKKIIFLFFLFFCSSAWAGYEPSLDPRFVHLLDSRHYDGTKVGTLHLEPAPPPNITWYIDGKNGDDAYDGQSPTWTSGKHGPKKTIMSITSNNQYGGGPGKGAHIIIKAGVYREILSFWGDNYWPRNDENNRIILGPYGDGEVIIDQSLAFDKNSWEQYDADIFRINTKINDANINHRVYAMVMDNDFKSFHRNVSKARPGLRGLRQYGDHWFDDKSKYFYVYTGGINPKDHDVLLLDNTGAEDEGWSVYMNWEPHHITFYGLTFRGSHAGPWISNGHDFTFDHCRFMYNNRSGLSFGDVKNMKIVKCFFYGNVMANWPRGARTANEVDGLWQANVQPATGAYFAGNIVVDGGGEGVQGVTGMTIEDNIFVDNFSVQIYLGAGENQICRRNITLTTKQDINDLYGGTERIGTYWEKILRKIRAMGVTMAAEDPNGNFHSAQIYNNIIIGARYGISSNEGKGNFGIKDTHIYNNLIIMPDFDAGTVFDNHAGFLFSNYGTKTYNSAIMNNIVIKQRDKNQYFVSFGPNESGNDTGITWDYNFYYDTARSATPFNNYYGSRNSNWSFAKWKSLGRDVHSVGLAIDPLLNKTNWTDVSRLQLKDFLLQATSPAKNIAKDLGPNWNTDYMKATRPAGAWDYGPMEHGASPKLSACYPDGDMCESNADCCGGYCCHSQCRNQECATPLPTSGPAPDGGPATRMPDCVFQNSNPDKACTPGEIIPGITADQICSPEYAKQEPRLPKRLKASIFAAYGISDDKASNYELDYLIPFSLGGSTEITNLWPQSIEPKPGYHERRRVTQYLHDQVCGVEMSLQEAQNKIVDSWPYIYNQITNQDTVKK